MFDLIRSIQERDAARPSFFEVFFAYPGFHAVGFHRVSHWVWGAGLKAFARFLSNLGRLLTGIEIHPAARIGKRLFIDHGMGLVIGETAEIGDDVILYHGVTLGGRGVEGHGGKRHPTVQDKAMIGAAAQVIGPVTVGSRARIGAGAVVTKDVPECCTAIGNPARIVEYESEAPAYGLPTSKDLDPMGETITQIMEELQEIQNRLGIDKSRPQ